MYFQNCVKTEQHSCEDFMVMTFALQKLLRNRIIFRTLLRKAVCDRRIFLCGSLVKAFCYAKRSATAPFSSGCILVPSIIFVSFSVSGKEGVRGRKSLVMAPCVNEKQSALPCHLAGRPVFATPGTCRSLAKTALRLVKPQNNFPPPPTGIKIPESLSSPVNFPFILPRTY